MLLKDVDCVKVHVDIQQFEREHQQGPNVGVIVGVVRALSRPIP